MLELVLLFGLLMKSDKAELIQAPSGSKSDHLEVQAGGLMLRDGEAGAAFGTVRAGKGKRQLAFFVVVKHELGKAEKTDLSEDVATDGRKGTAKQTLSLDGKKIELTYEVTTNDKDEVVTETLTVRAGDKDKQYELKNGRVLLVDLTKATPTHEQRKADLPAEVEAANKKATEELSKAVLKKVGEQDKKAKEFIDKSKS